MAFDYKLAKFIADIRTIGGHQGAEREAGLDPQRLQGPGRHVRRPGAGRRRGPRGHRHPLGRGLHPDSTSACPRSSWTSSARLAQSKAGDFIKVKKDEPAERDQVEAGAGLLFVEVFLRPEEPAGQGQEHGGDGGQRQDGQERRRRLQPEEKEGHSRFPRRRVPAGVGQQRFQVVDDGEPLRRARESTG